MVRRFFIAALILGAVVLLHSCSHSRPAHTGSKSSEPDIGSSAVESGKTSKQAPGKLAVLPGALEGTYLKKLWSYQHDKEITGLYYDEGIILICTADNELLKLNRVTGLPYERRLQLTGALEYPPVVYRYEMKAGNEEKIDEIFIFQEGDVLRCIEADSLLELWAENLNYGVACACACTENYLFVCEEGGRVNGMTKAARSQKWTFGAGATVSSPPVVKGNSLYVSSEDGRVYALNIATGWQPGSSWEGKTNARIITSPLTYQQRVYAASLDYVLYAFEALDGALAWKFHVGRIVRRQPLACRDTVFVIGEDLVENTSILYGVDSVTGECRWKRSATGVEGENYSKKGVPGVSRFLAPGKELAYVLARDKPEIWGLRISDGRLIHRIPLGARPDFVVSHDAKHGRDKDSAGLILLANKNGRILALKERKVY